MIERIIAAVMALGGLEIVGLITGTLYVILAAKENAWCWLFGGINVAIMIRITWMSKLYAEVGTNVVYLILTFYGVYMWLYGKQQSTNTSNSTTLPITLTSPNLWLKLATIWLVSTLLIGWGLDHFTDTDVPYIDALTTAMSLIATWMVAQKKLENWLLWIVVDLIYVFLFIFKGWSLIGVLYIIYTVIAFFGYFEWRKSVIEVRH